jgi:hypothetical protein
MGLFGIDSVLTQSDTVKLPLFLTLGTAFITLGIALRMKEPSDRPLVKETISQSLKNIAEAGKWILRTPAPLILILTGVLYDSFMRLYYTVGSNYYRLIGIDEAYYGVIGAAGSIVGIGASIVVARFLGLLGPSGNFRTVALMVFAGLLGISFAVPGWGVAFAIPLWVGMRFLHFFLSTYLNKVTDSARRATVLSFKGLSMNLAYGGVTLLFGFQSTWIKSRLGEGADDIQDVFAEAITWWPWAFCLAAASLIAFTRLKYGKTLTGMMAK